MNLRKAHGSVPRSALWRTLEKSRVSSTMISIIRSFHEDMSAKVIVNQKFTEPIGLRQGCTLASLV